MRTIFGGNKPRLHVNFNLLPLVQKFYCVCTGVAQQSILFFPLYILTTEAENTNN